MPKRPERLLIIAALAGLVSACAVDFGGEGGMTDAEEVRANAQLAVQQCGEGRVKSVDTEGYACKASGE